MSRLFLDFEAVDKGLGKPGKSNAWMNYRRLGIGPGWATGNKDIFSVLGAAVTDDRGMEAHYLTNMADLKTLVAKYDTLVMHNAQYDLGCLSFLGIEYEDKTILCTRIGAKLINNLEFANLDHLAKLYLNSNKTGSTLSDYAWESGLFAKIHKELTGKTSARKPGVDTIKDFAYSHLDYIQDMNFDLVADYAIQDIVLTRRLHDLFAANLDVNIWTRYSNINKVLVANRIRGVNVDIEKAKFYSKIADKDLKDKIEALYEEAGKSFNFNSTAQIAEVLAPRGLKFLTSATGKASITSGWMKEQLDPICQGILNIKALRKRNDDFLKKIIHLADAAKSTKVYPSFSLLTADTGRMTANEPNLQQIPKASKKDPSALSKSFRGIYMPSEGKEWFSMDFSAQEIRIALHYAIRLDLPGAKEIQAQYLADPLFDSHTHVANITGLTRDEAKAVNLGLSYGMGTYKLCNSLGLINKVELEYLSGLAQRGERPNNKYKQLIERTKKIKAKYLEGAPYIEQLIELTTKAMERKGYITSLGGRKIRTEPRKALNALIQGSAADQTMKAMADIHAAGLTFLFSVHDSIEHEGTLESALQIKKIMEEAYKLEVPVVADISGGPSWGEIKKIEVTTKENGNV